MELSSVILGYEIYEIVFKIQLLKCVWCAYKSINANKYGCLSLLVY